MGDPSSLTATICWPSKAGFSEIALADQARGSREEAAPCPDPADALQHEEGDSKIQERQWRRRKLLH